MTTKVTLRLKLEEQSAVLVVEIVKFRATVRRLPAEVSDALFKALQKSLPNKKALEEHKASHYIEQIHVKSVGPDDEKNKLRKGSKISLFIDDRHGRKPFWTDTVSSISTEVLL